MHIGIIGGGTMGLTMAFRLARAGQKVTVLEAGPQVGGLATWFNYGEFTWDKFYHVVLKTDSNIIGLLEALGIADKLRWSETKTGFLWKGRHVSMSNNLEFLKFPVLSMFDKVRLALGIIYIQRIEDAAPLERIKVAVWMKKIFGQRVYSAVWEPLLLSKYGVFTNEMPATIMWATIKRYYSTRSKGGGKETMGFVSGSIKTVYDALIKAIEAKGGEVRCSAPVIGIEDLGGSGVTVKTPNETFKFDRLISTLNTGVLRKIAPKVLGPVSESTVKPSFLGVVCMALVLKEKLNPYYVTNLIQKGFPFTGVIGVSCLTGADELNGKHLVMLPRYDVPDSEWFKKSDEEISNEFIGALEPVYPGIRQNIIRSFVNREKLVQAIWIEAPPEVTHPTRSESGNVWSVNAELAGRDTLNNNAVVGVADRAAKEFLENIGATRQPPAPAIDIKPAAGFTQRAAALERP